MKSRRNNNEPNQNVERDITSSKKKMKARFQTARVIIGVISIGLFLLIALQSCAAGAVNALSENNGVSGTAGFILALCMLIAGIIGICLKKKTKKSAFIAPAIFYIIGSAIAAVNIESYADLQIWAIVSALFGALFVLFMLLTSGNNKIISIIIPVIIFALLFALSNSGAKEGQKQEEAKQAAEKEKQEDGIIDYQTADYSVKYNRHEKVEDEFGSTCVIIYLDFTNNSDDSISCDGNIMVTAFQNGKELSATYGSTEAEELDNTSKEIKKDVTVTCAYMFELEDESNVELEVEDFLSLDESKDMQTLEIK